MPHKRTAFGHCATTSERATLLGVVSVMRRNTDGTWHGDMLDGLAFVKAQKDHGAQPAGARVLLLGAGGAGSAIAIALLDEGVQELVVHDVDEARAADLVTLLRIAGAAGSHRPGRPDRLRHGVQRDPAGHGRGGPASGGRRSAHLVDVRRRRDRRPRVTPFLAAAEAAGAGRRTATRWSRRCRI